ncbi:MAG TPA: translation elongation factor 4 [Candidatus Paceibacterota bacterium]|jgi:GTP-binding protein LepA|nr:translation elongation factor 4 [Candidatus Paceibacterota bacterium]
MKHIRNFVIIAHIDSGKSTLADRLLEITGTVPMRSMRAQYLDRLPLERERGITIKMAPVRMEYATSGASGEKYILNLIDTPGHSDFSYEVSRALAAVEGGIILVDATKGIQAQTLSNLRAAQKAGLTLIPAVNKIDLALPQLESVVQATADLLGVPKEKVFRISAKTGAGVKELLEEVIRTVPSPDAGKEETTAARALIFDSLYDDHKGIIAFARVFGGEFGGTDDMQLLATKTKFKPKEVGYFSPDLKVSAALKNGEIGYVATGLKEPTLVKIGDTIVLGGAAKQVGLAGYREVAPVVFISFYPDGATKFEDLKRALERLRLTDAALSFEPDANEALGRGLKVGFLGQLHFEITAGRLKDEFHLEFLTSFPSIAYRVQDHGTTMVIKQAQDFPDKPEKVWEPLVDLEILTPQKYLSAVVNLQTVYDIEIAEVRNIGDNLLVMAKMALRELIRDFDDRLKSVSQGYASFTYEISGEREADVEKLEILIIDEVIPALTRIVPKKDIEREGRHTVERLKELLPQEQFSQALQARALGRIVARETIPAMKKALGDFGKNGGDRTRKMKLWKKQARGKERLQSMARVDISPEVFREILKK